MAEFTGGAGICSGSITLEGCLFANNIAGTNAGAVQGIGNVEFVLCQFLENTAGDSGGAVTSLGSGGPSPEFTGCLFAGNVAGTKGLGSGGAVLGESISTRLTNCTITQNSASFRGGGVAYSNGICRIVDSIITGNTANVSGDNLHSFGDLYMVSFSDIEGGYVGDGNIDLDPLFVDPVGFDFRLQPGSPCIDTGAIVPAAPYAMTDLDGNPRVVCVIDMGAFESLSSECGFLRADVNLDGLVDIADAIATLSILFAGDPSPGCDDARDANDDGLLGHR